MGSGEPGKVSPRMSECSKRDTPLCVKGTGGGSALLVLKIHGEELKLEVVSRSISHRTPYENYQTGGESQGKTSIWN